MNYCHEKEGKVCCPCLLSTGDIDVLFSSVSTSLQIPIYINGNKVVTYLDMVVSLEYMRRCSRATEHVRYTRCVIVFSSYPPCHSSLNHFQLMY